MNDIDRLRLYRDQIGRDHVRWLFEMAALGIEVRRESIAGSEGSRETVVLAVAPAPQRRPHTPQPRP